MAIEYTGYASFFLCIGLGGGDYEDDEGLCTIVCFVHFCSCSTDVWYVLLR